MKKNSVMKERTGKRYCRVLHRMLIPIFTVALLIAVLLPQKIGATESFPDDAMKGSLTVTITDSSTKLPVSGGKFRLYQVAEVNRDGGLRFVYKKEFQEATKEVDLSGLTLKDSDKLGTRKYADILRDLSEKTVAEKTASLSKEGSFSVANLDQGIYLLVQTEPSNGYELVKPFVLTIPWYDKEKMSWELDVTSAPKPGVASKKPEIPAQNPPSVTIDSTLPLTGQMWWPVPVLGILGLVLVLVGLARRRRDIA